MIRNYLVLTFRNLLRNKIVSTINIVGLALGISASLFLFYYVSFELGYDDFHNKAENIYLLHHDIYKNNALESSGTASYYGAAPAIQESVSGIAGYVRLHRADGMYNHYTADGEIISHHETKAFYTDSTFFSVFSFPLLKGKPHDVLRHSNSLVISESAAKKYFGDEDPLGKVILLSTEWQGGEYVVEGVFKDIPENSHLQFDFLLSIDKLLKNAQFANGAWYWTNFSTYLLLDAGTNCSSIERKFPSVIEAHLGNYLKKMKSEERFRLQPLRDIHLNPGNNSETQMAGDYKMVIFLLVIAFLVVGIAWINYINLSTARATERAREVGMRKIFGSKRRQLVQQFLLESGVLTVIAMVVAAILMTLSWNVFAELIGKEIRFNFYGQRLFWFLTAGVILAGTLLSCLYPALVLSSFKPVSIVKGKFMHGKQGAGLRKTLVVIQFSAAILLIVSALTISQQIAFMRGQDLGISIEQKIIIRGPELIRGDSYMNDMNAFKNLIRANADAISVTASSEVPGKPVFWTNEIRLIDQDEEDRKMTSIMAVDEEFIPAYQVRLIAGRNFSKDRVGDFGSTAIINESALKLLGFHDAEEILNRQVIVANAEIKTVIGVVGDFHQQSLKKITQPLLICFIPWSQDYVTLSVQSKNVKETLSSVQRTYQKIFPENAFEYFFLDEHFDRQYRNEERSWRLFTVFSLLAVIVACMGLFGMSSFMATQRTKEIAIRKILGANASAISFMLSLEFMRWVIIAFVVAAPVAAYLMHVWLQDFAYRIDMPWWAIGISGLITLSIAWFTISLQSMKVAMTNPADVIRAE